MGTDIQDKRGQVLAISISKKKGIPKTNLNSAKLVEDWGLDGDAHAGPWHRQVSLLANESIDRMRAKGLSLQPGEFAENITTKGVDLPALAIGRHLRIGEVELEITQIGKECHRRCAIYHRAGDCVMPREGVFARVLRDGVVKPGSPIEILPLNTRSEVTRT